MTRAAFANRIARPAKRNAGRTTGPETPVNVRAQGVSVDDATRQRVREQLGRKLGKHALHIERATVRFLDVNGPRGGVDTVCRIKVVFSGLPSVVVEDQGTDAPEAFARAASIAGRTVRRTLDKSGMKTPRRKLKAPGGNGHAAAEQPGGRSLIGRTEGRSRDNLLEAQRRPEKKRRDEPVDTARANTSASDRKAGGGSSARRNTKLNKAGMTATLEDSAQGKPSRKSTRRSGQRAKSGTNLQRRQIRRTTSPKARARRAAAAR